MKIRKTTAWALAGLTAVLAAAACAAGPSAAEMDALDQLFAGGPA